MKFERHAKLLFSLSLICIIAVGTSCESDGAATEPKEKEESPSEKTTVNEENLPSEGWSDTDKAKAKTDLEAIRFEIESVMGDQTDAYIDCYLSQLEAAFPNLQAAEENQEIAEKISRDCAANILLE